MTSTLDTVGREQARLGALRESGLLDSPPEHLFDLITGLAARALGVPVVLMSLVDADRQFFKSQTGLPLPWAERRETPLSHSFCQYVSAFGEQLVVEDARTHPLVCDNLAVRDLGVVAYAGMPLQTKEGFTLGSLCAIDTKPRRWTTEELETLRDFAAQVMAEIELRAQVTRLDDHLAAIRASTEDRRAQVRQLAHDLRTPLNALVLGLEGLALHGSLDETQQMSFDLARRNADVLRDLVQRVIELCAEDQIATPMAACLPHEMVDRALDQVATLAGKAGVYLESSEVLPLPAVSARCDELTRVLVNLIANGVKFTPRGGTVTVSISEEVEDGVAVVRFTVRDTGIGIAPADQRRIFREGVRVDRAADPRHSSGIGLAFCRRVIEDHGGELTLQSALGTGSTFTFALPIKGDQS